MVSTLKVIGVSGTTCLATLLSSAWPFITWGVFKLSKKIYGPRQGTQAYLRTPDFASRCDELTDEERLTRIETLNKKDN
jgi:hypothetical protein